MSTSGYHKTYKETTTDETPYIVYADTPDKPIISEFGEGLSFSDGTLSLDVVIEDFGDGLAFSDGTLSVNISNGVINVGADEAYLLFTTDEIASFTLPDGVSYCMVLDTTDNGLYWYENTTYTRLNLESYSYCSLYLSANTEMSFDSTYSYKKIPLESKASAGSALEYDSTNKAVKVKKAGTYRLSFLSASNKPAYITLNVNDMRKTLGATTDTSLYQSVSCSGLILTLAANDLVTLTACKVTSANPTIAGGDFNYLTVEHIG